MELDSAMSQQQLNYLSELLTEVLKIEKCTLCLESVNDAVLLWPCSHWLCKNCIASKEHRNQTDGQELSCPLCKQPVASKLFNLQQEYSASLQSVIRALSLDLGFDIRSYRKQDANCTTNIQNVEPNQDTNSSSVRKSKRRATEMLDKSKNTSSKRTRKSKRGRPTKAEHPSQNISSEPPPAANQTLVDVGVKTDLSLSTSPTNVKRMVEHFWGSQVRAELEQAISNSVTIKQKAELIIQLPQNNNVFVDSSQENSISNIEVPSILEDVAIDQLGEPPEMKGNSDETTAACNNRSPSQLDFAGDNSNDTLEVGKHGDKNKPDEEEAVLKEDSVSENVDDVIMVDLVQTLKPTLDEDSVSIEDKVVKCSSSLTAPTNETNVAKCTNADIASVDNVVK